MEGLTRRGFLAGAAAAGAVRTAVPGTVTCGKFDEHLAVLISDTHVKGARTGSPHYAESYEWTINHILEMRPLPRHVVHFGDLAVLVGKAEDYARAKPGIKRLEAAGITVTLAMGNHDRRSTFKEVFGTERADASLVPGRFVSLVEMPDVGILMLDSLAGLDDVEKRPVDGDLSPEQQKFLADFLEKREKPVLIAAHHPMDQLKVDGRALAYSLIYRKCVVGYIHGHWHSWLRGWFNAEWDTRSMLHTIGLPSCGCDGDIGYCTMRTFSDRVEVELHQRDFYLPSPYRGPDRPPQWDRRIAENMASPLSILYFERFARTTPVV